MLRKLDYDENMELTFEQFVEIMNSTDVDALSLFSGSVPLPEEWNGIHVMALSQKVIQVVPWLAQNDVRRF